MLSKTFNVKYALISLRRHDLNVNRPTGNSANGIVVPEDL